MRQATREMWAKIRKAGGYRNINMGNNTIEYWATKSGKRVQGVRERYLRVKFSNPHETWSDQTRDANTGENIPTSYDK